MTQKNEEINRLVVYAVRYALTRHTYVVSDMADFLMCNVKIISTKNLSVLYRDIRNHLDDVRGKNVGLDYIDADCWERCNLVILAELMQRGFLHNPATGCWEKANVKDGEIIENILNYTKSEEINNA